MVSRPGATLPCGATWKKGIVVKRCASCAADIADIALHCPHCGAKQSANADAQAAISGAPLPSNSKTVMGYSAGDVIAEMLRNSGSNPAIVPPPAYAAPPPTPLPRLAPAPPPPAPYIPPSGPMPPVAAPVIAKPPPTPEPKPIEIAAYEKAAPRAVPPQHYTPTPHPLATHAPIREPYAASLSTIMILCGVLLIGTFVIPISMNPLEFNWDVIRTMPAAQTLPILILGAVGLISLIVGMLPMPSTARGTIAVIAALVPLVDSFIVGKNNPSEHFDPANWRSLAIVGGGLVLIAALLLRQEYRSSIGVRIVSTIASLAVLAAFFVPADSTIPAVLMFRVLMHSPGATKVEAIALLLPVVAVLALFTWERSTSSAGSKSLAWILILMPMLLTVPPVLASRAVGEMAINAPGHLLFWVLPCCIAALFGYGVAAITGRQLGSP